MTPQHELGAFKAHQRSAKRNEVPLQDQALAQYSNSNEASQPAKRQHGGQPGNSNSFKHGFYTKNFSLSERRGLQAVSARRFPPG